MSTHYARRGNEVSIEPDMSRLSIATIMPDEALILDDSVPTPQQPFPTYELHDTLHSEEPHRRSQSLRSDRSHTASSFVDTDDNCSPFESRDKQLKRSDSSTSTTPTSPETEMSNSSLLFGGQGTHEKSEQQSSRSSSSNACTTDSTPPAVRSRRSPDKVASPPPADTLRSSRDSSLCSLANRNKPLPVPEELQVEKGIARGSSQHGGASPLPTFSISPVIDIKSALVDSLSGSVNEVGIAQPSGDRSNPDASQRSSLKSKLSRSSQLFRRSTESKGSSERTTPSSSPRQRCSVLAPEEQPAPWYRRSATPSPSQSVTDLPSSKTATGSSSPARDAPLSRAPSPFAFRGGGSWLGSSKLDYLQERHLKATPASPADASRSDSTNAASSSRSSPNESVMRMEHTIMGPPGTSASWSNASKAKGEVEGRGGEAQTAQFTRPRLHRSRSKSMDVMEHFAGQIKRNIWEYGRSDVKADISSIAVGTTSIIATEDPALEMTDSKDRSGAVKDGIRRQERTRLSMLLSRKTYNGGEEARQVAGDRSGATLSHREAANGKESPFARLRRQKSTNSTLSMKPMAELPASSRTEHQREAQANSAIIFSQGKEGIQSLAGKVPSPDIVSLVSDTVNGLRYDVARSDATPEVATSEQTDDVRSEIPIGELLLNTSPIEVSDIGKLDNAHPQPSERVGKLPISRHQKGLSDSSGWDEEYASALSSAFSSSDQLLQLDSGLLALSASSPAYDTDSTSKLTASESDPACIGHNLRHRQKSSPAPPVRGRSSSSVSHAPDLRALTKMTPDTSSQAQKVPRKLQPSSSEPRDVGMLTAELSEHPPPRGSSHAAGRKKSPSQAADARDRSGARKPNLRVDVKAAAELDVTTDLSRPKSAFSTSNDRGTKEKGCRRPSQATLDIVDDLEFLQALEHVRNINKERIRKKEEDSDRVAQMARLGMASSNKRSVRTQREQSESHRTRDRHSGSRRPSRAPLLRRSSSADARYTSVEKIVTSTASNEGVSIQDVNGVSPNNEKPSALEMGVGRASGKMRDGAFLNDDDWKREVKALFVIRELVLTERSYARHLETLLQAVRSQYLPNRKTYGSASSNTRYSGQMPSHFALMRNLLPQLIALSRSLANRIDENPTAAGVGAAFRTVSSQMEATFIAWSASAREILDALRFTEKPKSKSQFRLGLLTLTPVESAEKMQRAANGFISVPSSPTLASKAVQLFPDGRANTATASHPQVVESPTSTAVEDGEAMGMPTPRSTKRRSTFSGLAPSMTPSSKSTQSFGRRALEVVVPSTRATLPGLAKASSDATATGMSTGTSLKRSSTAIRLTALSTPGTSTSTSTDPSFSVPASPPSHTQVVKKLSALDVAIMPTQRLPRYLLLLRDLNSSTPPQSLSHVRLQRCIDFVNEIASRCDRASQ